MRPWFRPVQPTPAARASRRGAARLSRGLAPYAYLLPGLAFMTLATFIPIVYTVYISTTNFSLYNFLRFDYVGLANFREILAGLTARIFWPVFVWTLTFATLTTLLNYVVGLCVAVLLNNPHMRERNVYRTLLVLPLAVPGTIAILAWAGMLNQSFGAVNAVLVQLGLDRVPWLLHPTWAKASILLVNLWLGFPYMMTVCLGGLQAIPDELYEAAAIDGAGRWQEFRAVTLPLLMRISLPLTVGAFAYNFGNFGIVYLLTGGRPPRVDTSLAGTTDVLTTYMYNLTLVHHRYALAAALSIFMFVLVAVMTFIQVRVTRAFDDEVRPA